MPLMMKVKDVMDKKVFSLNAGATVDEAVKKIIQNEVRSLVTRRRGSPTGS